jgi:N-acetylneuraminic acid mutarotase
VTYNVASGSAANTWWLTGSMNTGRTVHTATPLSDDRVLVTGGNSGTSALNSGEIYNPATSTLSLITSMSTPRYYHTATLLSDGRVLVTGGNNDSAPSGYLAAAEIYNPLTNTWSLTGSMSTGRVFHTATRLSDGRVLVSGGVSSSVLSRQKSTIRLLALGRRPVQ